MTEAEALALAMSQPAALNQAQAWWLLAVVALVVLLGWVCVEGE